MCGKRDESITHLKAECKNLAQKECKQRHANVNCTLGTMPEVWLSWRG